MIKKPTTQESHHHDKSPPLNTPVASMLLGVISLATFMWFLGIPALIFGILGLIRNTEHQGYSVTGLVTGLVSTFLLLCTTAVVITVFLIGIFYAEPAPYLYDDYSIEGDYGEAM